MFTENRSLFFDTTNGVAVEATINLGRGSFRTFKVIFDAGLENTAVLGVQIEVPNPSLVCQTADLDTAPAVTHATTIEIASVAYKIINRSDDGTGISTLTLQKL